MFASASFHALKSTPAAASRRTITIQKLPRKSLSLIKTFAPKGISVVLQRNRAGHYVTAGEINGQPVTFLLDTGATGVAIPAHLAEKLGIQGGRPVRVQTANGLATSYLTRLDSVSVGDIKLNDVEAGVVPGFTGNQILLGMSFLRHIEFTQRGRTLVLRQYY